MKNVPTITTGLIAVSRDCFPAELSRKRRRMVAEACKTQGIPVTELETIVENENDVVAALKEIREKIVDALAVYLCNFAPEGPTTMIAQ